jgi:hypothetical protein
MLSLSCCLESSCAGVGCGCPVYGLLLSYEVVQPSPHAATGAAAPLLPLILPHSWSDFLRLLLFSLDGVASLVDFLLLFEVWPPWWTFSCYLRCGVLGVFCFMLVLGYGCPVVGLLLQVGVERPLPLMLKGTQPTPSSLFF